MPELPEVQTTVNGLSKTIVGKTIVDVWSDFHIKTAHADRKNIKNEKYYSDFKKRTVGSKIVSVERKGKHIIINLSNKNSIIVHMKMTGHLMYGKYSIPKQTKKIKSSDWTPEEGPLKDPYNKFLHFVATLSDKKHLVLSDMRKFASVCIAETHKLQDHPGIFELGPDPLSDIDKENFVKRIQEKNNWPIKATLMNQSVVAGIGNIYSDEILWASGVHPLSKSAQIPKNKMFDMYENTKKILKKSIELGGDSMSDYRNAFGEKGGFQKCHNAYRRTNQKCTKKNCGGIIRRMVVKTRSAHYCDKHQIKY